MIAVTLEGQLGNQLFQYAFAMTTAAKLGVVYNMQIAAYPDEVVENFELIGPLTKSAADKISRLLFNLRYRLNAIKTIRENQDEVLRGLSNNTLYQGYFQSENYFAGRRLDILQAFRLKQHLADLYEIHEASKLDFDNSVVLHVRRGDYLSWGSDALGGPGLNLPASYYQKALAQIPNWSQLQIVVVTDAPADIPAFLPFLTKPVVISSSRFIDFQVMMHAKKLIISNSSFAWWAAYLNRQNADIFTPQYWLGFKVKKEHPFGIIPARFRQVAFEFDS